MRRLSVAAVAAIAFVIASSPIAWVAGPANAAVPAPNWTGFYIGGNVGLGWADRDVVLTPDDPATSLFNSAITHPPVSFNTSGATGGAQAGYNWQFKPNWLIGVETDFNWSDIHGSGSSTFVVGPTIPTLANEERIKWLGTVRARLGYLPTPNLLAYVTGGLAYGQVEHSGSYFNPGPGTFLAATGGFGFSCTPGQTCFAGSSSKTQVGWTLGGGIEYALWQNWTVKAEYLYIRLRNDNLFEPALQDTVGGTTIVGVGQNANFNHIDINVARVGVNYRF